MSSSLNVDKRFKDREGMRKPNAVGFKREVIQRVIKTNSLKSSVWKKDNDNQVSLFQDTTRE